MRVRTGKPRGRPKTGTKTPGSGRKKGTPNKRTRYMRTIQENAIMKALQKGISPLEVMMMRMIGGKGAQKISDEQYEAAKALAKFFHAQVAPAQSATPETVTKIIVEGGLPSSPGMAVEEEKETVKDDKIVVRWRKAG